LANAGSAIYGALAKQRSLVAIIQFGVEAIAFNATAIGEHS
jgi:hypothetical protein